MTARGGPTLVLDVILRVMAFSDDSTVSQMMKTNSGLYHGGAAYLLDHDYIRLQDERDVASLTLFMTAKGGYRFAYLRGLAFEMAALAEDVGNHFAFVFKSFSHLHRLTRLVISLQCCV